MLWFASGLLAPGSHDGISELEGRALSIFTFFPYVAAVLAIVAFCIAARRFVIAVVLLVAALITCAVWIETVARYV